MTTATDADVLEKLDFEHEIPTCEACSLDGATLLTWRCTLCNHEQTSIACSTHDIVWTSALNAGRYGHDGDDGVCQLMQRQPLR